ncbi:UDP-glucose 4-epimerase GalE [Nitratidesulfovibrio sp. SRB-5]|uniref:UDP-glucose 4-epimerase GalE n=1 Tax=Nitratidesulfovibrio sp. SRB-5 TaxID=2872636 RepID=UPI0010256AC8|nr:UDP-glucose 4-epimerase GalE [Nitratidesulfovibrio sp. SRB-5]MBZ2171526.1 UDP-glucose 4-epimerase GalE [Nitratidesulfovibrio sp. SRB-5]RXF76219.1 UDP-glucose 4-epimerase GalE [Desulfovibrio sp. DS-1]
MGETPICNVLVCGGAGYIGSHMVRALVARGCTPVIFDNLSTGHADAVDAAAPDCDLVRGDLLDRQALRRVFAEHSFDAVMHFSARSLVGESVREPALYYANNVTGTLNLLDAMREAGVLRLVFSSTAAVYGNPVAERIAETHPLAPVNPYGASKLMVERMLADHATAYGLRSVALRYFNAAGADRAGGIGESHSPETHLIPNILRAVLGTGPALTVFGSDYDTPDGTCVRDYIHVNDLCDAHLAALDKLLAAPVGTAALKDGLTKDGLTKDGLTAEPGGKVALHYNLGNGLGFTVRQVIDAAARVTGREVPYTVGPRRDGDPARLVADSTLAGRELGWTPKVADIREIIETAWAWHRDQKY